MLTRLSSILLLFFIPVPAFAQFADNTPAFAVIRPSGAGRVVHILDIVLKDNIAYAVGTGGLWTINVANISSPNQLGAFRPRGQIYGAALNGDYLYTFMRTNGMDVMNVAALLAAHRSTEEQARLKGFDQPVDFLRLAFD